MRLTLTTGDLTGALAAVQSLRTSSHMVGAEQLADRSGTLERSLRALSDNPHRRRCPRWRPATSVH
ncbi:hypothetical protein ACFVYC_18590 [Pseudarthrobacter sp. NPDC058329]|uniref:hypothetical protein n=1 Tax=Pseudarthrobacter sp. NPDC058329 TaxID=3346448 RepID=UPI0036DB2930